MSTTSAHQPLHGKVAVVTGGSNGIGAASVRVLAQAGARVVVGYHQGLERAETLRASLPGEGHAILQLPLSDAAVHASAAQWLQEHYGHLDVLVNSAGFTRRIAHSNLDALDSALFNEILLANAGGTYSITRAFMPLLRASGEAVVVNVSSVSAFTGSGSNVAYCAAKAAIDTMTLSLGVPGPNWSARPRKRRWGAWSCQKMSPRRCWLVWRTCAPPRAPASSLMAGPPCDV